MNSARHAFLGTAVVFALAATTPTGSAMPAAPQDARADDAVARERAREVIRLENESVRRRARIARLQELYRQRGLSERVSRLEELQRRDATAHRAALARLQQDLGTDRYERLRNSMRGQLAARNQAQQQSRERAAAASREPRNADLRRPEARPAPRPAPRPPSNSGRP